MKTNDPMVVAHDPVHAADLILTNSTAALRIHHPPFSHEMTPTAAEFLQLVMTAGAVRLLFFWGDELSYCRHTPPFLAVIGTNARVGFAYTPAPMRGPDADAVFARFTQLPLLIAGSDLIGNEAIYAAVMCRRGES